MYVCFGQKEAPFIFLVEVYLLLFERDSASRGEGQRGERESQVLSALSVWSLMRGSIS